MLLRFLAFVSTLLLCAAGPQQTPGTTSAAAASAAASSALEVRPLAHVVTIGASVTDGFFLQTDLSELLEAMFLEEDFSSGSFSTSFFFVDPERNGKRAMEFIAENDPTLVVALDFLFWFGYGAIGPDRRPIASEDDRLALLERGLALLDPLDVPLLVGDFPNMSAAVGRGMLQASQQPEGATLAKLNARLHAWAAERERVTVVPLASVVAAMRAGEAFTIGRYEWPADSTDRVLLPDRLHPTLVGLAGIAHLVGTLILERELATEDELDVDLAKLLETFGAELDGATRVESDETRPVPRAKR